MATFYVPSTATLVNVATVTSKTVLLPPSTDRAGRIVTIKDSTGSANIYPITISTQGGNLLDNGSNLYTISYPYSAVTFVSRGNQWLKTATSEPTTVTPTVAVTGNAEIYTDLFVSGNANITGKLSSQTISTIYGIISTNYLLNSDSFSTLSTTVGSNFSSVFSTNVTSGTDTSNYFVRYIAPLTLNNLSSGLSSIALLTSNTSNY